MLEDRVPTGGPRDVDRVVREAPSEVAIGLLFPTKLANAGLYRPRGLSRLVLNSPDNSMKWDQPSTDMSVPSPDTA